MARIADGQHFPVVPVAVAPVEIASAHTRIELQVIRASRGTAIGDAGGTHARENTVELCIIDMEAVVVAGELLALGEVQSQGLINVHRRKVTALRFPRHGENVGQGLGRGNGIARWNDQMVE